jgi:hypothetical protein
MRAKLTICALLVMTFAAPRAFAQQILPEFCFVDADCGGSVHCIEGTCHAPCATDGDCGGGHACVAGGCFTSIAISYPIDYGLADGNNQPGCSGDSLCQPQLTCVSGKCQNGQSCTVQKQGFSGLCSSIGGYQCASDGKCEAGACSTNSDCNGAYPISGLSCISGRCSSRCNADSDCCNAGIGRHCDARAQTQCYLNPGDPGGGVCAAEIATDGKLIVFQQYDPDPRKVVRNLVLISEGFTSLTGSDIQNFETRALRHYRWLLTKASVENALLRANVNLFILELRDRASGPGQPTLFGHFLGPDQLTLDFPGAEDQALYAMNNAVSQFAAANGVSGTMFDFPVTGVDLFRTNTFSRAFSANLIVFPTDTGNLPNFQVPPAPATDVYYVLQHELGHFLSNNRILDEYDNDSASVAGSSGPPSCSFNTVARSRVTTCSVCDGSDDGPFTPANAPWGPFVNTSTFPTTDGNFFTVGLYAGANLGFTQKAMRSQTDCVMRQNDGSGNGRTDFCPACREGLITSVIPAGGSQLAGLLELDGHIDSPVPAGDGPHHALAVSSQNKQAYLTRDSASGPVVTIIDTNLIDIRQGSSDISLKGQLGSAGIPRAMAVDDSNQIVYLDAANAINPSAGALLLLDASTKSLRPAVGIPNLVGEPLVEPSAPGGGQVITYAEPPPANAGKLVTFPLGRSPSPPVLSTPTGGGVLPRFGRAGLRAPSAGLDFFVADEKVPPDVFCDFGSCQIWALDPTTLAFRDSSAIVVMTPAAVNPGIQLAIVVTSPNPSAPVHGELLVAVTESSVFVWRTSDVAAGNTTPAATWPHNLGMGGKLLASVNYVASQDAIILGNKNGQIALFSLATGMPGPDGDAVALPFATPAMEVRDIVVGSGGATFIGLGGFAPPVGTPRTGLLATLDLSGNMVGSSRVVFQQIVDAVGLSGPTMVVDPSRDIIYTNAVINSGDHIGGDPAVFRAPILRGFQEPLVPPSGCP